MNLYLGLPNKPIVLNLVSTVVEAININGIAINSGLSIPPNVNGYTLPSHSDSERDRQHLCLKVSVVIIDEISWFQISLYLYLKLTYYTTYYTIYLYLKYVAAQKVDHFLIYLLQKKRP